MTSGERRSRTAGFMLCVDPPVGLGSFAITVIWQGSRGVVFPGEKPRFGLHPLRNCCGPSSNAAAGLFGARPHTGFPPPRTRNLEPVGNSGAPYIRAKKTASTIPLRRPKSLHLYGLWLVPASGSTRRDENQRSMSLAGKGLGSAVRKLP